jgi:hypothetical protein
MDPRIRIRIHTKMSWMGNTVKILTKVRCYLHVPNVVNVEAVLQADHQPASVHSEDREQGLS